MKSIFGALAFAVGSAMGQDCAWMQRDPVPAPDVGGLAMAFDSARGVTVLYSGVVGIGIEQTWEWDGAVWSFRTDDSPDSNGGRALSYDIKRGVTVYYDGEGRTSEWDGKTWTQRDDVGDIGIRRYFAMAYDSKRGVSVVFGGSGEDSESLGDTWVYDGTSWKLAALSGPGASAFNSMAFDSKRGVCVLYGTAPFGRETWEWDGKVWTQRDQNGAPDRLTGAQMIYDAARGVCVLYGGNCFGCQNSPSNETWEWDGLAWTKLDTPDNPGRRSFHEMAYDSIRHVTVLFGGIDASKNIINDTWELACDLPCYPDLNGDGTLDLFDFLAFVNSFNAGEGGAADCDKNGVLDLFDFLCFVNSFNAGC